MCRRDTGIPTGSTIRQRSQASQPVQVTCPKASISSALDKCSIYFTNFPDFWEVYHLWEVFKPYGVVDDIFIPMKRNVRGQRFGFIKFLYIVDVESLLLSLNLIWIGSFKLRFFKAKGSTVSNDKSMKSLQPTRHEVPQQFKSFVDVVKGDRVKPSSNQNIDGSKDPKKSNIENIFDSASECMPKQCDSSYSSDHIQISMENEVLNIKINIQELVCPSSSDSEENQSTTANSKDLSRDTPKNELPLVICNKMVDKIPNNFPPPSGKLRSYGDSPKMPKFPFGLFWNRNLPLFSSWPVGGKQLQIAAANSPSPEDALQSDNSFDSPNAPYLGIDQGEFCPKANSCDDLGSPCFSVHTRSTGDPNLSMGADHNSREVFDEFCTEEDASQLSKNRSMEGNSKDKEFIDDQSSSVSLDSYANFGMNKGEDLHNDPECDEGSDFLDVGNMKNIRKKKKCKNHRWSRKKIRSKVKVKVKDPSPPKFTVEDTCISESLCRKEAIKTLEVAKLIGISYDEEDEVILKKFMELEKEEREAYDHF